MIELWWYTWWGFSVYDFSATLRTTGKTGYELRPNLMETCLLKMFVIKRSRRIRLYRPTLTSTYVSLSFWLVDYITFGNSVVIGKINPGKNTKLRVFSFYQLEQYWHDTNQSFICTYISFRSYLNVLYHMDIYWRHSKSVIHRWFCMSELFLGDWFWFEINIKILPMPSTLDINVNFKIYVCF